MAKLLQEALSLSEEEFVELEKQYREHTKARRLVSERFWTTAKHPVVLYQNWLLHWNSEDMEVYYTNIQNYVRFVLGKEDDGPCDTTGLEPIVMLLMHCVDLEHPDETLFRERLLAFVDYYVQVCDANEYLYE
jgi:hypothetical protein